MPSFKLGCNKLFSFYVSQNPFPSNELQKGKSSCLSCSHFIMQTLVIISFSTWSRGYGGSYKRYFNQAAIVRGAFAIKKTTKCIASGKIFSS